MYNLYYLQNNDRMFSSYEIRSRTGVNPDKFTNLDLLNSFGVYPIVDEGIDTFKTRFYDATASYDVDGNNVNRNYTYTLKELSAVQTEAKEYLKEQFETDVRLSGVDDVDGLNTQFQADLNTVDNAVEALSVVTFVAPESSIAINGYYPLYTTEDAANSAGDGTSHTHEFDGVTYYMPNGVTNYHGNY